MKKLFSTLVILSFSFAPLTSSAFTVVEGVGSRVDATQSSNERVVRGKLQARYTDGKIETSQGTFSTRSVEVKDHRPINDWYKTPAEADVSLYFKDNRLTRVVIY